MLPATASCTDAAFAGEARTATTAPRIWLFGDYNQAESRVVARKTPVPKLDQWYREGVDVHSYVAQYMARVIQQGRITMPLSLVTGKQLFWSCAPELHNKHNTPDERDMSKRSVHGGNYDMGVDKLMLILGCDKRTAETLFKIYHGLFPEIKRDYHGWVEKQLRTTRTLWMPEPVKFRKVFHDISAYAPLDSNTLRSAYSCYPQCIVGALLVRTLNFCCNVFRRVVGSSGRYEPVFELREQWEAWYGRENWISYCNMVTNNIRSPQAILWSGMDVRLNIHDAGGISIPNDNDLIRWVAQTWRAAGEVPIKIGTTCIGTPCDDLTIPIDFKQGSTMSNDDLHDLKV